MTPIQQTKDEASPGVLGSWLGTLKRATGKGARLAVLLGPVWASAQSSAPLFREPTFTELANLTITTVSKKEENYFQAAASIHVITAEDIRRSGARMLPEVLRLSPGSEVGMINSRSYAVTLRGFNGTAANKVLPLIDGRSLYSQRFAGTIWDIRDLPLEDVEQVEVIGGPGGTTWGANAVNGVINIITKHARDTQGDLWVAGAGTFEQGFLYARHGFSAGAGGWARVYLKAFQRDDSETVNLPDNNDAWEQVRAGFRYDRLGQDGSRTMMTGDVFYSDANQFVSGEPDLAHSAGGHLLVKRQQSLAASGQLILQAYVDVLRRDSGGNRSDADVLDLDLVANPQLDEQLALSWGANYRYSRLEDSVSVPTGIVSDFMPATRWFNQASAFLEETWMSESGDRKVTGGIKAEYNDFTQWELMPSVRTAWTPSDAITLWSAWSRAARIPSRYENDQSLTFSLPGFSTRTLPSPELEAEILNAFELGMRWRDSDRLSFDVNLFYHDYVRLVTAHVIPTGNPADSRNNLDNLGRGHSLGAEVQLVWRPLSWWQLQATGTLLDLEVKLTGGSTDTATTQIPALSPKQQFSLRSSWNLGASWELDAWYRAVGELRRTVTPIPAYQTLDLRVGKQFGDGWEISVSGQNLLQNAHQEFRFFPTRAAVARGFYLRLEKRR